MNAPLWQLHTLADAFADGENDHAQQDESYCLGYRKGFRAATELFRRRFYATVPNKITEAYDILWDFDKDLVAWLQDVRQGKASIGTPPVPEKLFCSYCGKRIANQRDHVIPRSRGGSDDDDNLTWACEKCNLAKSDKPLSMWKEHHG